jgi:UDP-glucose 4-epimerase
MTPSPSTQPGLIVVGKDSYIGGCLFEHAKRTGVPNLIGLGLADCNFLNREAVLHQFRSLPPGDYQMVFLAVINKSADVSYRAFVDNVAIVENLKAACATGRISSLIFFSSVDVYGNQPVLPISEETRLAPDTWYGLAKQVGEWMLLASGEVRCPVTVLRIAGIYGHAPNDRSVISKMVATLRKEGKITIHGAGTARRDFVHVGDVCRLVLQLLPKKTQGVLNVATGRSLSVNEVAHQVGQAMGGRFEIVHGPADASRDFDLVFDNRRLRQLLPGFAFTELSAGLRSYACER